MDTVDQLLLANGTVLKLRHVQAADADALRALIEGLSPHDMYLRFHGSVKFTSAARIAQLAKVDPGKSLALVATARSWDREELVAEARWVVDGKGHDAEVAILVGAPWRHQGIGTRLLTELRRGAVAQGLQRLHGHVFAINSAMLALSCNQGFSCMDDPEDPRLRKISMTLATPSRSHSLVS